MSRWLSDASADLLRGSVCVGCRDPGRLICANCRALLPRSATRLPSWPGQPTGVDVAVLPPIYACGPYQSVLKAAIVAHKEQVRWGLCADLAVLLAQAIRAGPAWDLPVLVVPVPSRSAAVRSRGYDPLGALTARAVRGLALAGLPVLRADLLRVRGPVADQAGLGAQQRFANLGGRFACRPEGLAKARARLADSGPVQVVVCDDVITTGATAREGLRALGAIGVEVAAVATIAATEKQQNEHTVSPPPPLSWVPGCG